jgi:S1-C subfamily serine protease
VQNGAGIHLAENDRGTVIDAVAPGSPADRAGVRKGDKLVKVEAPGFLLQGDISPAQFDEAISKLGAGTKVLLTIEREGWERRISLEIAAAPERSRGGESGGAFLGVGTTPREGSGGGLKVERVVPGSPAERASVKPGDVIIEADGTVLHEKEDLMKIVQGKRPGDKLVLRVERDEWARRFEVVLGSRPSEDGTPRPRSERPAEPKTPSEAKPAFLGIAPVDAEGKVLVDDVQEGSPARAAGLKQGDKIVGWLDGDAHHDVKNSEALSRLIDSKRAGDVIVLEVERDGWVKKVKVKLGERPGE